MGPPEWIGIVEVLHRHYYDYDGFVVIMGTDTMAYAASAASFMMENLGKPVVFTGSMVPLCELYNDAKRNLVVACILAGYVDVPEVTLFINSTLFRGNRVTKVSCAPPSRAHVWQGLLPGGGQPLQDQATEALLHTARRVCACVPPPASMGPSRRLTLTDSTPSTAPTTRLSFALPRASGSTSPPSARNPRAASASQRKQEAAEQPWLGRRAVRQQKPV